MPSTRSTGHWWKFTVRGLRDTHSNTTGPEDNGWETPLKPEETVFIERRISHYGALLQLTLEAEDRARISELLAEAEWDLVKTTVHFAEPAEAEFFVRLSEAPVH